MTGLGVTIGVLWLLLEFLLAWWPLLVYGLVWFVVVRITYRWGPGRGWTARQAWRAAELTCLFMFLGAFWEWVPTVVARHYYCRTQAGAFVAKSFAQWRAEHPGVAETLHATFPLKVINVGGVETYLINERFAEERRSRKVPGLPVRVVEKRLVDRETEEVLARYVRVDTGYHRGWQDWKFWLRRDPCDGPTGTTVLKYLEEVYNPVTKLGKFW